MKTYIKFNCDYCNGEFSREKRQVYRYLNGTSKTIFCSRKCKGAHSKKEKVVSCDNCGKKIVKLSTEVKRSKSGKLFCSRSCSTSYNNKNKTHGTRRSKLEIWLEDQLIVLYPDLDIDFNQKNTIKSELDIYIPSLKLAFELNGIFHYEPIYGEDKLQKIQENDSNKFQECQKRNISLCTIDTSSLKHFKEKRAYKYLNIISDIIKKHM